MFSLVFEIKFDEYFRRAEIKSVEETHPLENLCRYAVLDPLDKNIINSSKVNPWNYNTCNHVLPHIVVFEDGILSVDQRKAIAEFNTTVTCKYRPFAGALKPYRTKLVPLANWKTVETKSSPIHDEQIEVVCFNEKNKKNKTEVYKNAFAQVSPKLRGTFRKNTEDLLSINIIVLDSTSLNAFRRHMPKTLQYFTHSMNALYLKGYMKVGDNSAVNLLPLLTGLRYGNQSNDMPSDYPLNKNLEIEEVPFIWNNYQGNTTL